MKNKVYMLSAIAASAVFAALAFPQTVFCKNEKPAAEERVEHYQGEKPENSAEAKLLIGKKSTEIKKIFDKSKLEDKDLEAVHEITYTLENAVDVLRAEGAAKSQIDALDEAVQGLHASSENQRQEESRQSFAQLEAAFAALENPSALAPAAGDAAAASKGEYRIVIKNHIFSPAEVTIPAGQKVTLKVENQDPTAEEFESHDFNREKIINGNSSANIIVGPLEPGSYAFFGEFNPETAQGKLIVK